jgi:hypothetical protein
MRAAASSLCCRSDGRWKPSSLPTLVRRWIIGASGLPLALRLILCLGSSLPPLSAAEALRKPFAIPAAAAEVTLETFSDQAGAQVLYLIDDVRGVATNPVQGVFAIREALERLATGTGLRVMQDEKTGAFVVKRDPNSHATAGNPRKPTPPVPRSMKTPLPARLTAAFAAFTAAALSAQTIPAASPGAEEKVDTVTMSPFQVSTNKDVGFVATSSLAGGRMSTDLKDTPLAYSVITKEFLDALSIIDNEEAMGWAVNSSITRDDGSDRIFNGDGGSRVRVRGVVTKSLRNFFELGRSTDTYSQERIDFARGTNALLIGNAGLGGASIALTKQAMFGVRKGEVGLTVSDFGAKRATLDFNQPLGAKVAARASLLWQDSDSWRDRVYDRRTGAYFTVAARPWKKTQLRVDYEDYRQEELLALTHLNDNVSGWDGVTVFSAATPATGVTNANAKGVTRLGNAANEFNLIVPSLSPTTVTNYLNQWRTLGGAATTTTPIDGVIPVNFNQLGAGGSYMIDIPNEPFDRYTIATTKSKFTVPTRETVTMPTNLPSFIQLLRNFSGFVDQQVGEHLFLQAAYSYTYSGRTTNSLAIDLANLYIDINANQPNGQPNPDYLQPYSENTRINIRDGYDRFYETRVAAAWVQDKTRFGSFRFNVIGGKTTRNTDVRIWAPSMARNADMRQRPTFDGFGFRYYLNSPVQTYALPNQITYYNAPTNTSTVYPVENYLALYAADSDNRTAKRNFDYVQASVFAKLFKERITVLAGGRRDHFQNRTWNQRANAITSYPADWDGKTWYTNPDAPANYFSLTTAQKAFYNPPNINQFTNTVTYGSVFHLRSWMSGFYNYAQTYDTSRAVQELNGNLVNPLASDGWDAGVRFSLLGGKVNASLSTYETIQNHTIIGGQGFPRAFSEANVVGDLSTTGRNARGLTPVPIEYFDYQDTKASGYEIEVVANLTKHWRLTYNLGFPETLSSGRYPDTWAFINANEATLKLIAQDAGATIDANNVATTTYLPAEAIDAASAVAAWNNMQTFKRTQDPTLKTVNSNYKFTTNLYTDYQFSKGRLKGLRVGAGVQYRSKLRIGNRALDTIVNPANPLTAIDDPAVDGNTPVYMDPWSMATATLAYEMKLKRIGRLVLNLNVSNLLDRSDPVFYSASVRPRNGDILNPSRVTAGGPFYYLEPRKFSLSARLNF